MKPKTKDEVVYTDRLTVPRHLMSLYEVLELIENPKFENGSKSNTYTYFESVDNKLKKSWGGVTGIDEYRELLTTAANPALNYIEPAQSKEIGALMDLVPSVDGIFTDAAKYCAGEPECMMQFQLADVNHYKTIHVITAVPSKHKLIDLQATAKELESCITSLELIHNTRVRIILDCIDASDENKDGQDNATLLLKDFNDNYIPTYHGFALGEFSTVRCLLYIWQSMFRRTSGLGETYNNARQQKEIEKAINLQAGECWISMSMTPQEVRQRIIG
jgi:hypothetical protein